MRKRFVAVGLGVILGACDATAQPQFPVRPPEYPAQPVFPTAPPQIPSRPLTPLPVPPVSTMPQYPSPVFPVAPVAPGPLTPTPPPGLLPPLTNPQGGTPPASPAAEVPLPHPEEKVALRAMDVSVKRVIGGWQVWFGQKMFRDLGDNETNARDIARVFRDLRPTEWVTIGGTKPIVEYGLTNGRPALAGGAPDGGAAQPGAAGGAQGVIAQAGTGPGFSGPTVTGAGAKVVLPIDLARARVEPIRGVWCVRDDNTLLFNFGTDKASAEQTIAVIRKYGFNRVGVVGNPQRPVMRYLFASLEPAREPVLAGQLFMNAQIDALTKTGIPVPGVGFTGEMVKFDPQKVEARKVGHEWVVAAGPEVLGRFGPTEWAAREAARTVRDGRFTEFCRLGGTADLTFFLTDGRPPTRAPFNAQGRMFDLRSLKVQKVNDKWAVTEGRKYLFEVGSEREGEILVRVLQHYEFDQVCHLSARGAKGGITFLVKNR